MNSTLALRPAVVRGLYGVRATTTPGTLQTLTDGRRQLATATGTDSKAVRQRTTAEVLDPAVNNNAAGKSMSSNSERRPPF